MRGCGRDPPPPPPPPPKPPYPLSSPPPPARSGPPAPLPAPYKRPPLCSVCAGGRLSARAREGCSFGLPPVPEGLR